MDDGCRICRGDEDEGPLFHPCKCTGTIKYVHQDCLEDWLERRAQSVQGCELCGSPYRFAPIYSDKMRPDSNQLRVYAYKLWKQTQNQRHNFSLLLRAFIMTHITSIVLNYVYANLTNYGDTFDVLKSPPKTSVSGDAKTTPYITAFALDIEHPVLRELYVASVNGFGLLLLTIVFMLMLWMISVWTLQDRILLVELHHLLEHGTEFNAEKEAETNLQNALEILRQNNANPVDRERLRGQLQANDVNQDWVAELNAEEAAAAQAAEDADFQEDEFWTIIDELFGGPLLPRLQTFGLFLILLAVLIGFVYTFPYIIGRNIIVTLWPPICRQLGLNWTVPTTLEFRIFTFMVGLRVILDAMQSPYRWFFSFMRHFPTGRNMIVAAKQIASIEKVFIVVVVEAIIFPLFCGMLLHLSFTPVMNQSPVDAVNDCWTSPRLYLIVQWVIGMCYMFLLSDFFKNCRKFLRPGVLYFVQDPSDPRNEPIRNFLSNSLATHFKKIGFSALIYTSLIVGCIGSLTQLIKSLGFVPYLVAPLSLKSSPGWAVVRYWPVVIALPLIISHYKGGTDDNEESVYGEIFRREFERAARWLDLGSFLFDWKRESHIQPKEGGYFVRAPIKDNFSSRRGIELFVPVTSDDQRIKPRDEKSKARELAEYKVVWRPAHFWIRVSCLIVWIWLVSAVLVTTILLLPLLVGRGYEYVALIRQPTHSDIVHWISGCFIACLTTIAAEKIIFNLMPDGGLYKLPVYVVTQGFFIYSIVDMVTALFAPSYSSIIHPSEERTVSYFFYGYCYLVTVGYRSLTLGFNWRVYLRLIFILLPRNNRFTTTIMAVQSSITQLLELNARSAAWKKEAQDEYYKLGDILLNYAE